MAISLSLIVVFGTALAFLLRAKTLGFGSAFVAVMFGFYLASTGGAGPVNHFVSSVFTALSHIH